MPLQSLTRCADQVFKTGYTFMNFYKKIGQALAKQEKNNPKPYICTRKTKLGE